MVSDLAIATDYSGAYQHLSGNAYGICCCKAMSLTQTRIGCPTRQDFERSVGSRYEAAAVKQYEAAGAQ